VPLPALTAGTVFAEDFRVIAPLAQGAMGALYVVEQLSTGRRRALKLMLP
jgi:serine/threonine-protein kinase